jgi:antitoxin component YwqK of YwqJK toxin-antitoxin module
LFYYESGEIEQRGFYQQGEYKGEWKWIFKNGETKRIEKYINGVEHGEFVEFDSLKNVLLKGLYNNGLREGAWLYHVNDHKEEGEYLSGQKNSAWIHTFSDGTIIFKGEYSYDEPVGVHKVWSSKGTLIISGKYKNGVKHGRWQYFTNEGEVDGLYKYKHGILIKVDGRKVQKTEQS